MLNIEQSRAHLWATYQIIIGLSGTICAGRDQNRLRGTLCYQDPYEFPSERKPSKLIRGNALILRSRLPTGWQILSNDTREER